jgi:four helix bundle protein
LIGELRIREDCILASLRPGVGSTFCNFTPALRAILHKTEEADQLFRAGTRVGANYRAACRARSHADFINKMGHVVEEADESVYWLELIRESGICQHAELVAVRDEAGQLSAIFNQSQLTAKSNSPRPRIAPKSHRQSVNS